VVGCYALWHFLQHEGVTFKKSLRASEQDRPDVARRRERWKARQARIDPRRLVFIDETWAKTNMMRARDRCPRGERLVAKAPFGRWRTLTFLAALRFSPARTPSTSLGRTASRGQPVNTSALFRQIDMFRKHFAPSGSSRMLCGPCIR
jgi:hypothetical protein